MQANNLIRHLWFVFVFCLFLPGCGANLFVSDLSVALLNQPYSDSFYAEDESWRLWGDSNILFIQSGGELPEGVVIAANGAIAGTPIETGNFEVRVTVYAIDDDWDSWDSWDDYDDDDVTHDSEWFTLFVTEPSSNTNCPAVNDETTTGLYLCLGTLSEETVAANQSMAFDMTYFIDFDKAKAHKVETLDFTIEYDTTFFGIDSELLNSSLIKEAAARAGATVDFDFSAPGSLRAVVTGVDKTFHVSGRFLELPFYALVNVPAGTYEFPVTVNAVQVEEDAEAIPGIYGVDGVLTVNTDTVAAEEEPAGDEEVTE